MNLPSKNPSDFVCEKYNLEFVKLEREIIQFGYTILDDIDFEDVELVASLFGKIMPQYGEHKIYPIKPKPKYRDTYTSQSRVKLFHHSEEYEAIKPVHRLVLYCEHQDKMGGGFTYICNYRRFLTECLEGFAEELEKQKFFFCSNLGITDQVGFTYCYAPIVEVLNGKPIKMRLSFNNMAFTANQARFVKEFYRRVEDYIAQFEVRVLLQPRQMLVVDNTLTSHSRSAVEDPERLLWRLFLDDIDRK